MDCFDHEWSRNDSSFQFRDSDYIASTSLACLIGVVPLGIATELRAMAATYLLGATATSVLLPSGFAHKSRWEGLREQGKSI